MCVAYVSDRKWDVSLSLLSVLSGVADEMLDGTLEGLTNLYTNRPMVGRGGQGAGSGCVLTQPGPTL
jgi:hypothetical protein